MSGRWNEDWKLPEGSGDILGEDWQETEEEKGRREEISDDMVDLVIGGLAEIDSESKPKKRTRSKHKRKRDDILLPEI